MALKEKIKPENGLTRESQKFIKKSLFILIIAKLKWLLKFTIQA
jgi:hypothetical protein